MDKNCVTVARLSTVTPSSYFLSFNFPPFIIPGLCLLLGATNYSRKYGHIIAASLCTTNEFAACLLLSQALLLSSFPPDMVIWFLCTPEEEGLITGYLCSHASRNHSQSLCSYVSMADIVQTASVEGLLTKTRRIAQVVDAVLAQIKLKAHLYHTFMTVLKDENIYLWETLHRYYCK